MFDTEAINELLAGKGTSINDLRDREFNGELLSFEEIKALHTFDKYRIFALNRQQTKSSFHKKYVELQALANLSFYEEFLKKKYQV